MVSKELINELSDIVSRIFENCNIRTDNDLGCSECNFHWNYSICNHGCFLVEFMSNGSMESLQNAMRFHKLDTSKIESIRFSDDYE